MSAPWKGELYVQSTPFPNLKNAVDDDGTWIAANCKSGHVEALVHRANAYPKLVEALEYIADEESGWKFRIDPLEHARSVVEEMRDLARAALASAREEGA